MTQPQFLQTYRGLMIVKVPRTVMLAHASLQALRDQAVDAGASRAQVDIGGVVYNFFALNQDSVDFSAFDFDEVKKILNADGTNQGISGVTDEGEIWDYPAFASVSSSTHTDTDVPNTIPGYQEGSPLATIKWSAWGSTSHPTLTDSNIGIPLVYANAQLVASEFMTLHGVSGYTLLNETDYRALLPDPV